MAQDLCTAQIEVCERAGRRVDRVRASCRVKTLAAAESKSRAARSVGSKTAAAAQRRLAQALAAAGHAQRLVILDVLLDGPATYRALQRATKLKAGPLYHHINQLRLSGLLLPKQRDLYELTRAGRNLSLTARLLPQMMADRRRRPVGS